MLYPDGNLLYWGVMHVRDEGLKEAQVPKDSVEYLLTLAERINYSSLNDVYPNGWDIPSAITSVRNHGKAKVIMHDWSENGTPVELTRFEEAIDRISQSDRWVRGH